VRKLVLTEAGPVIGKAALERIATYVGLRPEFRTWHRQKSTCGVSRRPSGGHSDAVWRLLTESWVRKGDRRRLSPHYERAHRGGFCSAGKRPGALADLRCRALPDPRAARRVFPIC